MEEYLYYQKKRQRHKVIGNMYTDPIHHVATWVGDSSAIAATDTAAGLNMCLLSMVIKYFDAIASPDAKNIKVYSS